MRHRVSSHLPLSLLLRLDAGQTRAWTGPPRTTPSTPYSLPASRVSHAAHRPAPVPIPIMAATRTTNTYTNNDVLHSTVTPSAKRSAKKRRGSRSGTAPGASTDDLLADPISLHADRAAVADVRVRVPPAQIHPLTHWPALVRSVFSPHNESLNIHTHFVPMVLWGAAFWGVGCRAPNPPPPDVAESLFTLFALACLACSALWHTMAGCAHRGAMEACARVDYVSIGWLIATSIATVVHHGILYPSILLHSGAVEVLQKKAADAVQALMHPSTLLYGAEKAAVESGKWVDGVESGSVLADMLAGLASFAAPLRALLVPSPPSPRPLASLSSPLHPLFNVAASLFTPVFDFASALNASFAYMVSATSNATSSLAAWLAYHPVSAGCLLLCAAAGVSGNVLPFCGWFNRVENRALAPLAGIAALQGWDTMIRFVAPVGPSLLYYIVGLVVYATQVPERFLGGRGGWVGWVSDMCGGGSHGIWHIFIALAMRTAMASARCGARRRRAGVRFGRARGLSWLRVPFASASVCSIDCLKSGRWRWRGPLCDLLYRYFLGPLSGGEGDF
ncbi:hemolysin-III related-domain-containing protein [Mycena leptocephala]|nr:hemolysin-III related-domain-containing protein [Mycena leptocephala]